MTAVIQNDISLLARHAHGSSTGMDNVKYAMTADLARVHVQEQTGASDVNDLWFVRFPKAVTLLSAMIVPAGSATASDSDYATLTLKSGDGAAGSPSTIAVCTTKTVTGTGTGDWVADTKIDLSSSKASTVFAVTKLAAGSTLEWLVAKANSGIIMPAYAVVIEYQLT